MPCGSCGGRGAQASNRAYQVTVGGVAHSELFETTAAARIWIANNVKGVAATVRAISKPQ